MSSTLVTNIFPLFLFNLVASNLFQFIGKLFTKEHEFTPLFLDPHYCTLKLWHSINMALPSFLNMLNSPLSSIIVLTFHLALSNVSPTSYSCNNCYIPEGSTWSHRPWSRLLSTCFFNFLLSFLLLVGHLTVNRRILDGPRGCQSLVIASKNPRN